MSEDLREEILKQEYEKYYGVQKYEDSNAHNTYSEFMKNALDSFFERRSMELLEYMALNRVDCGCGENKDMFLYKGECISKEELFQNFL